jgi:tetratricopeptide (TPR) repeat protein
MAHPPPGVPGSFPELPPEFTLALADRYRLLHEIGAGGMAVVYLAEDLKHHRQVALKVLRPEIAPSLGPERFLREIEIAARLTHPNILPLHDSGEAAGFLYYVMPYVDGPTLRRLLDERGYLPLHEALIIVTEVADALEYAHAHGVVHRDIKPENILLASGHAVVADFGIARAFDVATATALTAEHVVIGSPRYMSPEQRTGYGAVDQRSDIYSLGCVLSEMLSGEPPSTGPSPIAPRERRPQKPFRAFRGVRPGVVRVVEQALNRALALPPEDRYPTAAAFAKALRLPVRPGRVAIALGVVALILGGVVTRLALPSRHQGLDPRRVVVTPFANLTGLPRLDQLGISTAHWLVEGLEQAESVERTGPVLRVVSMATTLQVLQDIDRELARTGSRGRVRTLSGETGAGLVVSGSFTREGDSLVLHLQVQNEVRGSSLGPIDPVKGPLDPPEAVLVEARDRLVGFLASRFDERLASFVVSPVRPPTYAAYSEASQGLEAYGADNFEEAARRFRRAYELDTTFASALVLASISLSNRSEFAAADSLLDVLEPLRSRLSSHQQHWVDYRRALMAGDHPAALIAVRRVAEEEPGSKAVYNYALEALQNGRPHEAIDAFRSLSPERGPMRGWIYFWDYLGLAYHLAGDFAAELDVGRRARAAYPDRLYALNPEVRPLAALGRIDQLDRDLEQAGRLEREPGVSVGTLLQEAALELRAHGHPDEARRYWERSLTWLDAQARPTGEPASDGLARANALYALDRYDQAARITDALAAEDPGNPDYVGLRGVLAARIGEARTADSCAARLAAMPRKYSFGVPSVWEARIAAVRGQRDSAVTLLRKAFQEGREYDLWIHRDIELESLRGYPPFEALVRPKD